MGYGEPRIAPNIDQGMATLLENQPNQKGNEMTKGNANYGHMTANQVRDVYFNKAGLTLRQMARKYGVTERMIKAARLEQHRRRNPGSRGRVPWQVAA